MFYLFLFVLRVMYNYKFNKMIIEKNPKHKHANNSKENSLLGICVQT
jgi:hypothetical protein